MKKLISMLLAPIMAGFVYGNEPKPVASQDVVPTTNLQVKEDSLESLISKGFLVIDNKTFDAIYPTYKDQINLKNYDFGKGFVHGGLLYVVSDDPSAVFNAADEKAALMPYYPFDEKDKQMMNIWESVYILKHMAKYEAKLKIRGKERRHRVDLGAYGTAMAYKRENDRTYLVTNEHVVSSPEIIHSFFGTYLKIGEKVEILDSKDAYTDEFLKDNVLTKVEVRSKKKDIAVVSTEKLMPYYSGNVGDSLKVKNGNKVLVVGFPLALGKVQTKGEISDTNFVDIYDPFEWDYKGFILDAAISPGSSGSPVFKIEEKSGENDYSWIGQIHAAFTEGQLMNLGIDINEYKGLLENLKEDENSDRKVLDLTKNIRYKINKEDYEKVKKYLRKVGPSEHGFFFGNAPTEITNKRGNIKLTLYLAKDEQDLSKSLSVIDFQKNGYGSVDFLVFKDGAEGLAVKLGDAPKSKFEKTLNELYRESFSWFQEVMEYRKLKEFEQLTKEDYKKAKEQERKIFKWDTNEDQSMLVLDVLYTIDDIIDPPKLEKEE